MQLVPIGNPNVALATASYFQSKIMPSPTNLARITPYWPEYHNTITASTATPSLYTVGDPQASTHLKHIDLIA